MLFVVSPFEYDVPITIQPIWVNWVSGLCLYVLYLVKKKKKKVPNIAPKKVEKLVLYNKTIIIIICRKFDSYI